MARRGAARTWLRVVHIGASVGWLATVGAFVALAILGLTADRGIVEGVYTSAAAMTWFVIIPLCGLTLASGIAIAITSSWGLLRHYWVVFKLAITVAATVGLIVHLAPIQNAAAAGVNGPPTAARVQLLVASALALALLLAALSLSTFRPRGLTKRGARAVGESALGESDAA